MVYECEYCTVDCHHAHTIRRHLQKRHMDIKDWQENTFEYIKSLRRINKNTGDIVDMPADDLADLDDVEGSRQQVRIASFMLVAFSGSDTLVTMN